MFINYRHFYHKLKKSTKRGKKFIYSFNFYINDYYANDLYLYIFNLIKCIIFLDLVYFIEHLLRLLFII